MAMLAARAAGKGNGNQTPFPFPSSQPATLLHLHPLQSLQQISLFQMGGGKTDRGFKTRTRKKKMGGGKTDRGLKTRTKKKKNRLLAMNYINEGDDDKLFEAHREWGRWFMRLYPQYTSWDNPKEMVRPLVIGYVSPDYFTHSVSYFIEAPLLCHDYENFKVVVYSAVLKVSDPWFAIFLAVFISGSCQHLFEVLHTGGSFRMWWNEQRIWMVKSILANFFGCLDLATRMIGAKRVNFGLTSKVIEKNQVDRYSHFVSHSLNFIYHNLCSILL